MLEDKLSSRVFLIHGAVQSFCLARVFSLDRYDIGAALCVRLCELAAKLSYT